MLPLLTLGAIAAPIADDAVPALVESLTQVRPPVVAAQGYTNHQRLRALLDGVAKVMLVPDDRDPFKRLAARRSIVGADCGVYFESVDGGWEVHSQGWCGAPAEAEADADVPDENDAPACREETHGDALRGHRGRCRHTGRSGGRARSCLGSHRQRPAHGLSADRDRPDAHPGGRRHLGGGRARPGDEQPGTPTGQVVRVNRGAEASPTLPALGASTPTQHQQALEHLRRCLHQRLTTRRLPRQTDGPRQVPAPARLAK
ncbi:MAG: hypothetical protein ACI8PZ_006779 [Myxococcota bacterium]|jgi:hypothetical protein